MTVQTTISRADYQGNNFTTLFTVPFYFIDSTHMTVILTDESTTPATVTTLVLSSDYTVAGVGVATGGSITTTFVPTAAEKLSILRNVPLTQLTHYTANTPFPAASHENALDQLTMLCQQIAEATDRAMTLPPQTSGVSVTLPTPAANLSFKWNATADALIATTFDPDNQSTDAAASAAEAAASADASAISAAQADASWLEFHNQYLGAFDTDPTLDNSGNPLNVGDLYWHTTDATMRIFSGAGWQDIAVAQPAGFTRNIFSGTGTQTAFTLSTTPPSVNAILVSINGVTQRPVTDFTFSGTTLTFTSAPPTGTNNILALVASTLAIGVPSDGSVTTAKLADASVTLPKIDPSVQLGRLIAIRTFSVSGPYTKNPASNYVKAYAIGGGGSSGGSQAVSTNHNLSGGGGAGGCAIKVVPTSALAATENVIIGAGGGAPTSGNDGLPGGSTSFGSWCAATGGQGGAKINNTAGGGGTGAGGQGLGGDVNLFGQSGATASIMNSGFCIACPRSVAPGPYGSAGPNNAGSGGRGQQSSSSGNSTGDAGSPGMVFIEEYA